MAEADLALTGLADLDRLPRQDIRAARFLKTNRVRHGIPLGSLEQQDASKEA
jgi:hypothetical protein